MRSEPSYVEEAAQRRSTKTSVTHSGNIPVTRSLARAAAPCHEHVPSWPLGGVHDRRRRRSRPSELEFRYQSSAGAGGVFADREREAAKRPRPSSGARHRCARQSPKRKTTCTLFPTRSGSAFRRMTTSRHEHGVRGARTRRAPRVYRLPRWHRRCLGRSRDAGGAGEQGTQARRAFAEPRRRCARSRAGRRSSAPTPHRGQASVEGAMGSGRPGRGAKRPGRQDDVCPIATSTAPGGMAVAHAAVGSARRWAWSGGGQRPSANGRGAREARRRGGRVCAGAGRGRSTRGGACAPSTWPRRVPHLLC